MQDVFVLSCIFVCKISILFAQERAKWTIVDPPIVFGTTATLGCTAVKGNDTTFWFWNRGPDKIPLVFHGHTLYPEKYDEFTTVDPFQSFLHIHDFAESDVEVNYSCINGFYEDNHKLELKENYFEYHPDINYIAKAIVLRSGHVFGEVSIPKVYPEPICKVMFQGLDISTSTEVKVTKKETFFAAKIVINKPTDECKGLLEILCVVGKSNFRILNEFINECQDLTSIGHRKIGGTKTEDIVYKTYKTYSIPVIVLAATLALSLILWFALCFGRKKIQKRGYGKSICKDGEINEDTSVKNPTSKSLMLSDKDKEIHVI